MNEFKWNQRKKITEWEKKANSGLLSPVTIWLNCGTKWWWWSSSSFEWFPDSIEKIERKDTTLFLSTSNKAKKKLNWDNGCWPFVIGLLLFIIIIIIGYSLITVISTRFLFLVSSERIRTIFLMVQIACVHSTSIHFNRIL